VEVQELPSVKILFFGATADAAGTREEVLELNTVSNVDDALKTLLDRHPRLSGHKLLIAVNEEYISPETVIKDGDELAIFTAVSGG
jgi:molybdopterin converting factor subunit 1